MNRLASPARVVAAAAVALAASPALAIERAQPTQLPAPARGSLAGAFGDLAMTAADVTRGGFTLAAPMQAPQERGPLLAPVFPSYNPDHGLSVWGMGWSAPLAITRFRLLGALAWSFDDGDELAGPYGRMVRGDDGDFYPVGLSRAVRARVEPGGDAITVFLPDGSRWEYGGPGATLDGPHGTFAWHLRAVRDAVGRRAELAWAPMNDTGNLALQRVSYGGAPGAPAQYRIDFDYEPIASADASGRLIARFVDYRAGRAVALDHRVSRVTVRARHADTGVFHDRWAWELLYDEEPHGAAFYLASIERVFASGDREPAARYGYRLESAAYGDIERREVPQLAALFADLGVTPDIIQPDRAAVTDIDLDGNPDLELGDAGRTLIRQVGSATADDPLRFEVEALPPPAPLCTSSAQRGCTDRKCRAMPTAPGQRLAPRMLSELNPTDDTVYVIDLSYSVATARTTVTVCTREGLRLSRSLLPGRWSSSPVTRFVDVNRDHLPDLVRVEPGAVEVVPAAIGADGGLALSWPDRVRGSLVTPLGSPAAPELAWVSDVNGDGLVDVAAQVGASVLAFYGTGDGRFEPVAQELAFVNRSGTRLPSLAPHRVIPTDLNKDGLLDYFLTNADAAGARYVMYFVNDGAKLVEVVVPALDALPGDASQPVIATLDGSGNLAVSITRADRAYSIQLDEPATGLMVWADDGKGTVVDVAYERGPATPGVRRRHALLARMDVTTSGYDTLTTTFAYRRPTLHSLGKYLVGFDEVERSEGWLDGAPRLRSITELDNGDDHGGLVVRAVEDDARAPEVARVVEREYEDASYLGVPWRRPARETRGFTAAVAGGARAVESTRYDAWTGVCPTRVVSEGRGGVLIRETALAAPSGLVGHLHCLPGEVVERGEHADPELDFVHVQRAAYDASGQLTALDSLAGDGVWPQQRVRYDALGRMVEIEAPGHGAHELAYHPTTGLPVRERAPDGVVRELVEIDPVRDLVLAARTDRGAVAFTERFRYDGLDRLERRWDDLGGASEDMPNERIRYAYATRDAPAAHAVDVLVDADAGVWRSEVRLASGAGEELMAATLTDAGWITDGFVARSRAAGSRHVFRVRSLPAAADPVGLEYAELLVGAGGDPALLSAEEASAFGHAALRRTRYHDDVERVQRAGLTVDDGGVLTRRELENGDPLAVVTLDADGARVLAWQDASGARWEYDYDVLGRLRAVRLPGGARHTVRYDDHGRVAHIRRDGVAAVSYEFAALDDGVTSDLVARRVYASAPATGDAVAVRAVTVDHDAAGRVLREVHADLASGDERAFRYYYDGATAEAPDAGGAAGMLTAVTGDGFDKRFAYRADGRLVARTVAVHGFRTVEVAFAYRDDGSARAETLRVLGAGGEELAVRERVHEVDAFGRVAATWLDGAPLVRYEYGATGLVARAVFATGDVVELERDELTRDLVGLTQLPGDGAWGGPARHTLRRNARGLTGEETYELGGARVRRTFDYAPRGFLVRATDEVLP